MLVLSHGHLTGVQDNASESNVFTGGTFTDRDSMLSAVGVASIVVALMILLLSWMLRLNADEAGDRAKEDDAREHFRRTAIGPARSNCLKVVRAARWPPLPARYPKTLDSPGVPAGGLSPSCGTARGPVSSPALPPASAARRTPVA